MADIKSLIDKFNIFRTKDSILNDVAKDNGQITIDIKQPFSDDIDSNNSLKTKLETNIKDKLFNTEINNVGSNIFDEKIKPFDKVYNVSNTPDTDTKTPIDTTPIKPDTPTIEKNTADATNIQQEKIQQPKITTPKPKQTQQYKTITEQQKPKLTTDSLGNPMPTNLPKKGTGWSGVGQQQIDDVFNLIKNDEEKFNMFQTYLSEAYNQLKSANLNDTENIIYVPFSYDHENGNMQGITLRFGLGQKEWAEKQLKILAKGINDKQNEEWLSNLELPQPEKTMDKMRSNPWLQLFSFMQPPTEGMDPESKRILESGQKENRLNAIKWGLIENIKECKDILDKYYKDKSQVGIALSQKNISETINNVIFPQIDLVKQSEIKSIISKYKEKPKSLTPIENEIVKYYSDYVNALSVVANKTSTGYETTKAIETSLPFMADFLRFNLVGSATRGGTRAAMKIGGKGLARQIAKDTPKTIGARAFKLGEDILTAAGHTSVSPLTYTNMLEDYSQTMETNGQYTKNDLRRGVIEAFTENFSERMFGALKGILPKSNNAFVNSLFGNNPVIKTMQKHMNVGGLLEETGEEYAGAFVNTMFGFALGDEKLASSFKEQLNNSVPTILSIGITVGLPQAIGMGIDFREIKKMNTRFNVAENNLKQYFNKENSYLDINRYSDALKSLYINLNNAKNEENKTEIKGKIAELNKTAANLAMEKGDSNGFNLISEYSIAAQNSFYVTNKAMSELKNMSEEDRTKLSDNAINKLKNDFTNNLNWSLISRAAAKNITDQNGKQHPTCFLYTDNGVTYVLNGQKDNMFYFVDVNGNTISKSADELRNNENLSVLHLNNLLSSFSNKELEDINSKFIDIAQYNAGYRYKVNDNGEIRYYTDNKDLIKSNIPYEQINRDKIESHLVGSYDLVRIDNITNAVEDMANAFAEPATEQTSTEQTSTEQTSTEQQKPAQEPAQETIEQPSEEPIQEQPQEQPAQEPAQEQPSEEPIQEQPQEQPIQEQPIQEQQPAQEEDDSTALNGVPDIVDDTPQDARTRGFRRVNGYKIDRQKPLQAVNGKEISVRFSNDVIANGHVAVIDAEQLQPSHIQGVRNPLHFIDEAQPKERNDEASIVSAQRIAKNIRPEEITSSVTAYTGAPIINARGETIQGNNRSDALRLMWSQNKDQAEKYKQYLIDHAQEFGLNAEDIAAMERPILVNMIDVSDEDAIALGQYVAQDTESGGLERIKPKNAVQKMGADMRTFANLLLSSNDDEISFAGLIDKNGVDVLNWLGQKGYITPTQYKSAFDTKGYITAEAKNDLRGIMYQSIFQGGSTRLEEMFNTMPAKAQKAILATAFRDYDSPKSESMIVEIQNSIRAYYALSQSADFMNAKTYKDVRLAVEGWKKQYQIDDATGESYLPAENFSNFALLLATMYKGEKQTLIQGTFNKLYDLIQGTQEADLFETPDNTPRTLSQAIKEVLNIDYNGQQRNNVLVGDTTTSQRGEQGSTRDAATRERTKDGERTADSAGSIEAESRIAQNEQANTESQGKKPNEVKLMNAVEKLHNKAVAIPGYTVFEYRPEYYTDGSGALVFGNKISASVMPIDDIKTETIADEIKFSVLSPDKRKQYKAASKIRMTSDYAEYLMKFEGYSRADANMIAMRAGKELQFIIKDAKNRLVYDMFLRDVFIPLFEEVLGKEELMNNPIVKNYYDGVFDEVKQHKADAEMHRQFAMTAETAQEPAQEQTTQETAQEQPIQEQTTEEQETTEQEPIQPTQQEQTAQEEDNSTAQNEQENTKSQGKKPNIRRIGRVIGSSLSTDEFISETMSIVIKDVKTFPKEIRDEDIISKEQKSGKRIAGIKVKVGLLGNDLYIQYREGRSFANKNKELWEKVKRRYWATIKIPNATNYSAGQLRYRLDYAGTTTDIARIVSDAVLELFHKKELRLHKSSGIGNVSIQEAALRDALIDKLREAGIDVITDVEEAQRVLDEANGNDIRQQKTTIDAVIEARDNEYLEAVRNGDLDKAQRMVVEAAKSKGYNSNSDYQGTSAFNGKAPYGNGYFLTKEERKEAWDNDEYDGDQTLGDYIHRGIDVMNFNLIALDPRHYRAADPMRKEAIDNVRNAIQKKSKTITMYRSVPSDVKEGSFRNGDWVTPSRAYAVENAKVHGWGDNFNIIEQKVPVDEIWWDGNDIAEWGYGREEDFVNDKDFAYKNTKNNRKLLDAVTYDDNGNVIPLSKRFNESKSDIRFFRTADGNAYGFTVGGKIYIDQRIATADTPIHEYAHLWASAMQKLNPNEWENIVKLMKSTPIWEEVKRNYPELTTDNEIADEVLAFYSGSRGAERLREEHAKILKGNGNVIEKVKAINAIKRVREALKRFWKNVAEWFGIHFTTAEEVADKVLSDLLNGVNPTLAGVENDIRFEENSEEADIVARAKADGTYMKAPNGKQSNLSPRQWVQVRTKAFKDWFGDWTKITFDKNGKPIIPNDVSKVVDENGEPMVVYHGFIGGDFNIFDKDVAFDNSRSAKPVYGSFFFSDTRKQAEAYGSFFRKGERVFNGIKATFLNIKNPFIINSENTPYHSVRGYFKNRDTGEIDWNRGGIVKNGWEIGVQDITIAAMEEGYDGVIFRNIDDAGSEELVGTTHTTLAVFSPTQIKSATDNVGTFDQNNPDIRYQFVGEKGAAAMDKAEEATIRLDNLAVARDMEKAGKDAKDIKLATGWERGAEGKWRYEILDLKYFGKGDAGYKKARGKQSWSKELDSLSDRIFNGEELSEEEQKRFEELAKEEENFKTDYLNREKPYLSDWVENDELFKAYPDLKRVQIVFTDQMPENIGGIYKDSENTIIVNTNYVDNISSVLAHEVQHAIQYIEGFAKGGSEESVQDLFDRAHSEYMARVWADELEEKAKEMGEYYNQTAVYDALVNDYKGFEDYMPNKEERIKGFNYFVRGYADRSLDNLIEKFRADERVSINSHNEYMKLAGEVEARNVQSRLGMSAEERRRSLAIETEDVERKDQIFLEDGLGVSASEVDKKTNAENRRASNRSVISSRFERQAEIQREEKNTKSAANIVLGNANVVLNDTNIFDEQYQNAIDNNLIDENVSPLIDSFGITWGYQLKNGVIVINKDVFVSDILDKRVKDNLSLLISSLMKTNKTFFKEGISFFKKLPIWVLYKNDTKSNEDTIKEIINDILLGNTSIDTNKLELLKQYTVQDMNDILDNATKWFEKFEGISSNMFAGNSISDILDTTLGDLMPKEITTTQEGKRLNWFSKLGIDIRSKLFDSLDWFRVVSDKTKDKTASELYDAMIVHTKRVQGKIDIFDKEYVRPIIDTIQSMLGKDFGNSTLSLDLIQEYFAIKSLLGRTASLYKEKFELYLTNPESKKPPMFDEFKQIYDEITEDEIKQRINEMGEKSSMSILQKVDIDYLMEEVRRTLAAEMFVKQYVYSSANTLNQGLQGEQSLGLINEVTNEPYSELYQLLYSDEQSSQTMHSPIEIIEQADILIDRAGLRNEFDFIGNQIQAILNHVNIERVENGLMSYDTFAKRQLMKDFVNQRGENSSEGGLYEITAKQKANEKMKGKDWFNPNSITSIIAVAQTEIATMEKELLAQRLSYFLTNPNNFDVLSQYGMIIDEKETLNEELSEDERNSIMDKNIVLLYGERHTDKNTKGQVDKKKINILKRNDDGTFTKVTISFDNKFIGLEEFVKFVNNNFKYEELRGISKAVAPFTAWTSRIYTILSPLFPTKNLFKDLMVTPWLPAKELNGKNSQYAIKNFYNVFNNLSFILKMSFTEKSFSKKGFENKLKARSQELFEYYLEYSKQHSIFSIEDQIGALSKENKTLQDIERALSGKENKFIKFTERALLIKFMQHYAELFENLHKFSAYVTLRKLGYGEERSAQIANNATLNYDRSGSIGRQLNAIIPFAKAALGGLYRTNYLLPKYNPKGFLQRVITLAVLGVMQGLMYDPDDDDISEFARKSGMVFGSFLYPLLPEELSIVRPVRALVIVMTGKKSPAYFKQELMESTIDLVPVASDALRGAFSYNPLTNKTEFDVGQLFANTDKMTAFYALAMLASYINENKNSFGKNVLLNEETNTDKTRYGRTKQDYGLYDYLARLYNSIINGVDIDDRAAMSNKIGKNGERLMTIAKEDVEFVINNYIPFGRLYAYTAEIIYDAVNDKRINKGHIPLIGGLFAQKSFGKDYYLVNNIKYELKDFTNDFSQSQIEDIKTNILVKADNRFGIRYKALKDNNANPRMLDIAKQKMNDAFNVFILDINNFVNDNGDKKIDFTEDEYKFMLKSFLDSPIMKKALSIGEDTLNKHTAKRVERTYKRYKKHNNENIDTDKENMKDAAKNFKKMLYDKSITEEEFNNKLNSLYEPLFQQIKLRAKFAGYSIE